MSKSSKEKPSGKPKLPLSLLKSSVLKKQLEHYARDLLVDAITAFIELSVAKTSLSKKDLTLIRSASLPTYMAVTNVEEINRDTVAEHQNVGEEMNPAGRRIEVVEHYVRMDYEGDGIARLYKVTTGSEQGQLLYRDDELDICEFDDMPFAAMTPVIVTHRFFGRSLADLTMDIQRQKTAIMRQWLDNAYLKNNQRVLVDENKATDSTLDDLLIARPGGIVRTKGNDGVTWQEVPDIGTSVIPMIEYIDSVREVRTGVQRQGQAINADALQNQSATAVNTMFTIAQAKSRLIARIFAETGIKDLYHSPSWHYTEAWPTSPDRQAPGQVGHDRPAGLERTQPHDGGSRSRDRRESRTTRLC